MKSVMTFKIVSSGLLAFLVLTSCSAIIPSANQKRIFILGYNGNQLCRGTDTIRLMEADSSPQQYTNKIWFQKGPELGYYQFAEWSESTSDRISSIIRDFLRCSQNLVSDSELEFSVSNLVHSAEEQPGKLLFSIRLKLKNNGITAKESVFSYEEQIKSYDVDGVVEASSLLMPRFLADLSDFIASSS